MKKRTRALAAALMLSLLCTTASAAAPYYATEYFTVPATPPYISPLAEILKPSGNWRTGTPYVDDWGTVCVDYRDTQDTFKSFKYKFDPITGEAFPEEYRSAIRITEDLYKFYTSGSQPNNGTYRIRNQRTGEILFNEGYSEIFFNEGSGTITLKSSNAGMVRYGLARPDGTFITGLDYTNAQWVGNGQLVVLTTANGGTEYRDAFGKLATQADYEKAVQQEAYARNPQPFREVTGPNGKVGLSTWVWDGNKVILPAIYDFAGYIEGPSRAYLHAGNYMNGDFYNTEEWYFDLQGNLLAGPFSDNTSLREEAVAKDKLIEQGYLKSATPEAPYEIYWRNNRHVVTDRKGNILADLTTSNDLVTPYSTDLLYLLDSHKIIDFSGNVILDLPKKIGHTYVSAGIMPNGFASYGDLLTNTAWITDSHGNTKFTFKDDTSFRLCLDRYLITAGSADNNYKSSIYDTLTKKYLNCPYNFELQKSNTGLIDDRMILYRKPAGTASAAGPWSVVLVDSSLKELSPVLPESSDLRYDIDVSELLGKPVFSYVDENGLYFVDKNFKPLSSHPGLKKTSVIWMPYGEWMLAQVEGERLYVLDKTLKPVYGPYATNGESISNTIYYHSSMMAHSFLEPEYGSRTLRRLDIALTNPAPWAVPEVTAAIDAGLVPFTEQTNYPGAITRLDFCRMAARLVEQRTGMTMAQFLDSRGVTIEVGKFKDTGDPMILAMNALGVLNGRGSGVFDPQAGITRAEAAALLSNTAKLLGIRGKGAAPVYTDADRFPSWAAEQIANIATITHRASGKAVMGGVGDGRFLPDAPYTREQAYITAYRLLGA